MTGNELRRIVLDVSHRARVGHIGSCLCVADILATLYGGVMRIAAPRDPDRDRFVLAKGHAALALYAALHLNGVLSAEDLASFGIDGSPLGVHADARIRGIDFSTGSLGHGLGYGVGAALAARLDGSARATYVLASDAELNEGSTWESAMLASSRRLGRLVVVIDANGQQALGATRDVLDLEPLSRRFEAFGFDVREIDGHDPAALAVALARPGIDPAPPRLVLARTVFGKGVPFMESRLAWHYLPMSDAQHREAVAALGPPS